MYTLGNIEIEYTGKKRKRKRYVIRFGDGTGLTVNKKPRVRILYRSTYIVLNYVYPSGGFMFICSRIQ